MKWFPVIFLVLLSGVCAQAKLTVVTTTEDLASIAKSVAGDNAVVTSLAKGTQDPHFLEAKPSYMVTLSHSDLVICIGLSLESGWLPLILRGARRPDILPGNRGYLEASQAITAIEVNTNADRSEGDVHPFGNPHFMADPERALQVAELISQKMGELDPPNAAKYQANLTTLQSGLKKKIVEWKKALAPLAGLNLIGYHSTFNYFFEFFKLKVVAFMEPKPGIPPGPQHIQRLRELVKTKKIKLILMENFFDPKPATTLAEEANARLLVLPAYVGGDPKAPTYEAWMDYLVSELKGVKP